KKIVGKIFNSTTVRFCVILSRLQVTANSPLARSRRTFMTNQNQATTQDAQALMQLYDLRREPLLRTARKFMISEFWPQNYEEFKELMLDFGNERNAFARQCFTYWDMAAAMVLRGAIHEQLFFDVSNELYFLFAKFGHYLPQLRGEFI